MVKLRRCSTLVGAFLCSAQGFAQEHIAQTPVTHDKALLIAKRAAVEHGYDLKEYSLLPNKNDLAAAGKGWFFLYVCKKPAPGCAFSVTVNSVSGAAEVDPGE
jgi:hypothetical protein